MSSSREVAENGWTAVPVDAGAIFTKGPFLNAPEPITVDDIEFPSNDPIVAEVQKYVKEHLPAQTFNHSMRVFYFCTAIAKQQFPTHQAKLSPSTLALTCLLHDIGTAEKFISATNMSFEFYGGIQALNLLQSLNGSKDQAEAVVEAIIRHQDLGTDGTITFLGQVIQLATIYDNVGQHPRVQGDYGKLVHETTRADVNRAFPRGGWEGCFAATIREEKRLKPWCHTTHILDFEHLVEGNQLMKEYK
ncbi:hypothetical protein BGZ63DRAFT_466444 [Mariannaea sp. PMI_226]|nr:hypothetical protein BGZ63DRAFT_466444 [Mariannaea sp. PMI_226]